VVSRLRNGGLLDPRRADATRVRRQSPGRVVSVLTEYDELALDELGPRARVDYGGEHGREWLRELLGDLADDGLIELNRLDGDSVARLCR